MVYTYDIYNPLILLIVYSGTWFALFFGIVNISTKRRVMMKLYEQKHSSPRINAQENLMGRTHYVDPGTLKFHHSRILETHITDKGLLFSLIESVSLDMYNTKRGYRYVVFDIFGTTVERPKLEDCFASKRTAQKALWKALNSLDAKAITQEGIRRHKEHTEKEIQGLEKHLETL